MRVPATWPHASQSPESSQLQRTSGDCRVRAVSESMTCEMKEAPFESKGASFTTRWVTAQPCWSWILNLSKISGRHKHRDSESPT